MIKEAKASCILLLIVNLLCNWEWTFKLLIIENTCSSGEKLRLYDQRKPLKVCIISNYLDQSFCFIIHQILTLFCFLCFKGKLYCIVKIFNYPLCRVSWFSGYWNSIAVNYNPVWEEEANLTEEFRKNYVDTLPQRKWGITCRYLSIGFS